MSDVRKYDLPAMKQFVEDLDKRIATLATMHESAHNSAKTVRAGLTGKTGKTADLVHADWQTAGEDLLSDLRAMRNRIANAAKNYEAAERANSQMLGDL